MDAIANHLREAENHLWAAIKGFESVNRVSKRAYVEEEMDISRRKTLWIVRHCMANVVEAITWVREEQRIDR